MNQTLKNFWSKTLLISSLSLFLPSSVIFANNLNPVVINEIAWAGSPDSSTEEWIELYNPNSQSIDISGWTIDDDDGQSSYAITNGNIPAFGYFLIEAKESSTSVPADFIIPLSLANTGDKLVLKDQLGNIIDTVNSTGAAWFAGNSSNKSSMERIDATASGDDPSNWSTSTISSQTAGGTEIFGTPKKINSQSSLPSNAPALSMSPAQTEVQTSATIEIPVEFKNIDQALAYGLEIHFDPNKIQYLETIPGDFLNQSQSFQSSFQSGLSTNQNSIIIGETLIENPKVYTSGSGTAFTLKFEVTAQDGENTSLSFDANSFVSGITGDLGLNFQDLNLQVKNVVNPPNTASPVQNLQAKTGNDRFSIELNWNAPNDGADKYLIYRLDQAGNFIKIGEQSSTQFLDNDQVSNAGNLVVGHTYTYKVITEKNGIQEQGTTVTAAENRGIKGDFNRSDRVDGRDLELLGQSFGSNFNESDYKILVDSNYDGQIDASDLIELGTNWAKTY